MANKNKRSPFSKALVHVNLSHIPGPRGLLFFKYVKLFQNDILGAFTKVYKDYGHIASFPWPMNSIIIYSPSYAKKVLVESSKNYIKGEQIEELRAVVGDGLATNNDHESWKKSRSIISKVFTKNAVDSFCPKFEQLTLNLFERWQNKFEEKTWTTDICEQMKFLTFNIAAQTLLGANLNEKNATIVNRAVHFTSIVTYERIFKFFPLPYWLPTKTHREFHHHFNSMNEIVLNIINEEKNNPSNPDDRSILQRLVHAHDEESGHRFSQMELRDEALTLMLAGHETSAHSLTWIIGLLAKNIAIQRKLQQEIDQQGDIKSNEIFEKMLYLQAIMKEGMRLYPAFPVLSRKANCDDQIGEFQIPKNTNVVIPIFVMQRSEEFWERPLTFDPERFVNGENDRTYKSLPFSRGPRRCVAETFAMVEMSIILFHLFKRFNVELVQKDLPEAVASVSLKPLNGMPVRLTLRS